MPIGPIEPTPAAPPVTVLVMVDVVEDDVGAMCISDAKIRDHKTDMYHPRLSVDHSKR